MADPKPHLDYRGKDRAEFQTVNELPSRTVQSESQETEIQHILKRYKAVGLVEHLNLAEAKYADVSEIGDFADAMRIAKNAEMEFMKLPSKVREIFDHDVANWLDTAHDPEKRALLVAAGFIEAEPEPAPASVLDNPNGDAQPGDPDPPAPGPPPTE